ncbi:hypothetical protein [Candidatus Scalindua japonica]|nr:hypothetical protein [Candidatus Scalindua japonica]
MAEYRLGITLTEEETGKIVEFLKTLTGEQPEVIFLTLQQSTSDTTQPDRD